MKKVFFTLTLFIPIAFLLNCGSSLKSTQQSTESLKPTSVSKTIVVGSDTLTLPSGLTLDTLPAEFSIQTEKVVIELRGQNTSLLQYNMKGFKAMLRGRTSPIHLVNARLFLN